jgi:deferrochelatase/peroxidase EfeB
VPFHGLHQAGIATPIQENLVFASIRVNTNSRAELTNVLRMWSLAAYMMTTGSPIGETGAVNGALDEAPEDTGEALDTPPSNLTVTIGFGPTLFRDGDGTDRFGIASRAPKRFGALPVFPNDVIDPAISGGDICIQACADDLQVALHAVRNLVRLSDGAVSVAWSQIGFGKSAQYAGNGKTGRNLFGFKDGTNNISSTDERGFGQSVWVQPSDGQGWMTGGTFLAVRKIRMLLELWDESRLDEQQEVFGRTKGTGAPLSGGGEFTRPDFAKKDSSGAPLIPPHSHMALASPANNGGTRILRRAFNYLDGTDAEGLIDSGLFFLGYVRDLERQFIPMQRTLSELDLMNEYVRYTSSSAFAIPPGARTPKDYVGQGLFV